MYIYFILVTASDVDKLQQQIEHLMELIQQLTMEFRAVKTEMEESRVNVNSICEVLNDVLGLEGKT
jgi:archaellum component FlaC